MLWEVFYYWLIIFLLRLYSFFLFPLKISLVILLCVYHTIFVMLILRICYWINLYSPNFFFYSHQLLAWYCIDVVRRNSLSFCRTAWWGFYSLCDSFKNKSLPRQSTMDCLLCGNVWGETPEHDSLQLRIPLHWLLDRIISSLNLFFALFVYRNTLHL